MDTTLFKHIRKYSEKDVYPFHMPGHKRNSSFFPSGLPWDFLDLDVTEIPGMDNLHNPKSIIMEAQNRAKNIFKADESFFVVNGSTGGMIAAICAVALSGTKHNKVLVARNCHRSVYAGLIVSGAEPVYIMPGITNFGIAGIIRPEDVKTALENDDSIVAVVITSPTYEGIVSDIKTIAGIVHEKGKILIVDEAHGAHFAFSDYFPKSAVELEADIVIQSLHKTLPALTQTAILHVKGERAPKEQLKTMLAMLQTSSPSYIFLACADYCLDKLSTNPEVFSQYVSLLSEFRELCKGFEAIKLMENNNDLNVFDLDLGKLTFLVCSPDIDGYELEQQLFCKHNIQIEASYPGHIIAMTSPADTRQGFNRLFEGISCISLKINAKNYLKTENSILNIPKSVYTPRESVDRPFEYIGLNKSIGAVSSSFIIPYPPGIPIVVPGEIISQESIDSINFYFKNKISVLGLEFDNNKDAHLRIIKREG